ncbi:MAG: bifunctional phosphopantothenoylcysteine decarboxylase/phosphopantothenate--cysteine ligase CoaBC [Breznakia sp.]
MKQTIIIGVTSSIAAFKSVQLVSDLLKKGYDVEVIMSENATKFITPLTFSSLTKHKTYVDTFDREVDYTVEHISLAKRADAFILAPASANIIAKIANGICDDMLSTTFLAATCPKLIAPAMNTNMYHNPIMQENLKKCLHYGMQIVEPDTGLLACGDVGNGKLADIKKLHSALETALYTPKLLANKTVLISAGPTVEEIDPVRFISNHSSGKMGYALATMAQRMGANVTLISGPVNLDLPYNVTTISVKNAKEMSSQMKAHYQNSDIVIMAAAVGDFLTQRQPHKLKKHALDMTLSLHPTEDILAYLGKHKTTQTLCGFAMESEQVIKNAKQKLHQKNCDALVVNDLFADGAGFQVDTNKVNMLFTNGAILDFPLASKESVAEMILKALVNREE